MPGVGDAFEFVLSSVLELDSGAGDEESHAFGGEELGRLGESHDAGGDVDRDARDVGLASFDVAGMDADAEP